MQIKFLAVATLAQLASSVIIEGYLGEACTSEELFVYEVAGHESCQNVIKWDQSSSIVVSDFKVFQGVGFYKEANCKGKPIARFSEKLCYTEPHNNVKSFRVVNKSSRIRRDGGSGWQNQTESAEWISEEGDYM